jgi:hypothetical protein
MSNELDKVKVNFLKALDIFVDAYKANVGKDPYAIHLGPKEYTLLCMSINSVEPSKAKLTETYKGIPIHVQMEDGLQVGIEPARASALWAQTQKAREESEKQVRIEGV